MPNEQEQAQQQARTGFFTRKLWDSFYNYVIAKPLGWRRRSYEVYERPGEFQPALILREPEMRQLKDSIKNDLLKGTDYGLGHIEQLWNNVDSLIVFDPEKPLPPESTLVGATEKPDKFVQGFYSQLGPYTNPYILVQEMKYYITGANYKIEEVNLSIDEIRADAVREMPSPKRERVLAIIDRLSPDERRRYEEDYKYTKVSIDGGDLIWDPRDPTATEKVYSFGRFNVGPLLESLGTFITQWTSKASRIPADPIKRQILTVFREILMESLGTITQQENSHFEYLRSLVSTVNELTGKRTDILANRPPPNKIRFAHTYKVIQPFIFVDVNTRLKADIVTELQRTPIDQIGDLLNRIRPVYFNPNKNPYADELKEVNERINNINETGVNREINRLQNIVNLRKKKLDEFIRETSDRIEEIIEYFSIKILRDSGVYNQLEKAFATEQDETKKEEMRRIWRDAKNKFKEIMKHELLILADIDEGNAQQKKEQVINQIRNILMAIATRIREEDERNRFIAEIDRFINSLIRRVSSLEVLGREDFRRRKTEIINTSINQLKEIDIDTDGTPEIEQLIRRLCDYSTRDLDQGIDRLYGEIMYELKALGVNDDEIQKILVVVERDIKNIVKAIQNEFRRIERVRSDLNINNLIAEIGNREQQINNFKRQIDTLNTLRSRREELQRIIRDFAPNHPNFFQRDNEVDYGFDENGMPLEVDDDGTVLLDKWWWEIGQNDWQMQKIRDKGGDFIIRKIEEMKAMGRDRAIRKIDPRFVDYIDILEMATYISNEWDSFRDDFRDGRYHTWSKTSDDYIISIEGFGMYVPYQVRKIRFPMRPIKGGTAGLTGNLSYINARPEYFETSEFQSLDEKSINRRFRIRLLDGTLYPTDETLRKDPYADVRKPTHLNPAFDRRAINFATNWIHWGRMYYYEWTDGINKWSENPYPRISTRGISKYIIHRILNDTFKYEDAVRSVEDAVGYDIGIRRPLVGGDFLKNPLRQITSQ